MATRSLVNGYGNWMPDDFWVRRVWISRLLRQPPPPPHKSALAFESVIYETGGKKSPSVENLRRLIEHDSTLYMLVNAMFEEVPTKAPYDKDPTLKKQVRNYKTMLYLFEVLLKRVPEWIEIEGKPSSLVGFPFNIILDWPMGTPSGRHFFLDPRVNKYLQGMLNEWAVFLKEHDGGNAALINAGWASSAAIAQLEKKAKEVTGDPNQDRRKFSDLFEHPDGGKPENFFNYKCWDDFFTRKFKKGVRNLAESDVVNACESFPLAFDTDISRRSTFWLKGTPYSLRDMLGAKEDPKVDHYVEKFNGGAVYQAFLSADSYHCWNAPVTGQVVYRSTIEGSYYAETADAGFGGSSGPDPAGPDLSQRYIAHVATRGVLIIDTDQGGGPGIGLVAFVPIGMAEVSSCQWEPATDVTTPPKTVKKGDLIGAFHGGGSTHCLLFQRDAMKKLVFNPTAQYPETAFVNLGVNSELATKVTPHKEVVVPPMIPQVPSQQT